MLLNKKNTIDIKVGRFINEIFRASRGFTPLDLYQNFALELMGTGSIKQRHPQTLNRKGRSSTYCLYPLFVTLLMPDTQISVISTTVKHSNKQVYKSVNTCTTFY